MLFNKFHFTSLLFRQFNMLIIKWIFYTSYFIFFLVICIKRSCHKFGFLSLCLSLYAAYATTIHVLKHAFIGFKYFWLFFFFWLLLNWFLLFKLTFSLAWLTLNLRWLSYLNFLVLNGLCVLFVLVLLLTVLLLFDLSLLLILACAGLGSLLLLLILFLI